MDWRALVVCVGVAGGWASVAAQGRPDQVAIDEAVRLGTVAALAPVCGLRDEAWAFDLRRAAILKETRSELPEDPALKGAPGSEMVIGALSFAEAEALENFAERAPAETCGKLARDADVARADELVQRFRTLKSGLKPSS